VNGGWVDLSHPLTQDMPRVSMFPAPTIAAFRAMPADPLNVTEIHLICHVGTHLDAPRHFIPEGETVDELSLDRLSGDGIVCRINPEAGDVIGIADLLDAERIRAGDIVFFETGWAQKFGTPAYHDHPSLSIDLAQWLVTRRVGLIALDLPTPDLAVHRRGPAFDWPVHHILLGAGVLIVEHVGDLSSLSGSRVEAVIGAIPIRGADGAPARVVARRSGRDDVFTAGPTRRGFVDDLTRRGPRPLE
jgi:kynurenine formamidase